MANLELFGTQQQPTTAADNGALDGAEEDPAAAFLAQQENEIAGIENDEGYSILESGEVPAALHVLDGFVSGAVDGVINGDVYQESNGPTDSCAAISQVDRLQSEPESIHKWREEQKERLEHLDVNSRKQEAEWKEKAIKELEEWYARQDEKLQKTKASNSYWAQSGKYSLSKTNQSTTTPVRICMLLLLPFLQQAADYSPRCGKSFQRKGFGPRHSILPGRCLMVY
ncbi:clathrin light chain A isoform X4 [Athene noctua]|uniref:clathrin light chain A isoform X4 n=1 Tax=Athene noctua TaxID=126797 RepID=UPI003EB74E9D